MHTPIERERPPLNKPEGFTGGVGLPLPAQGASHLDWSFEHQFSSSSRTLSEEIGK